MSNNIHEENQPEETVDERIVFLIEAFQEVSADVGEYSYNEKSDFYEVKAKDILIVLRRNIEKEGYVQVSICLEGNDETIFVEEILLSRIYNSNRIQIWTNLDEEYWELVKDEREIKALSLLRYMSFKIFEARGEKEKYSQYYFNVERIHKKLREKYEDGKIMDRSKRIQ